MYRAIASELFWQQMAVLAQAAPSPYMDRDGFYTGRNNHYMDKDGSYMGRDDPYMGRDGHYLDKNRTYMDKDGMGKASTWVGSGEQGFHHRGNKNGHRRRVVRKGTYYRGWGKMFFITKVQEITYFYGWSPQKL
jgi:hypothetical protein